MMVDGLMIGGILTFLCGNNNSVLLLHVVSSILSIDPVVLLEFFKSYFFILWQTALFYQYRRGCSSVSHLLYTGVGLFLLI